ncbi:MAG: dihydroorotate dehydrogenase [Candidatus Pacebacteria bacterium]|nr:dihydroorotate dehydrogenase [Candidatus Paceibacterota bacterium]MBP9840197.1 dihydroorotate dehydrogenase [Candidatus Paceibacterota bacterium]
MAKKPWRFMNAAGTARSREDVGKLALSKALTEITVGSFTTEVRPGNGGRDHWFGPGNQDPGGINSLGMPNRGLGYVNSEIYACAEIAKRSGKTLRVSIASNSPEGLAILASAAYGAGASTIEANFGCPNDIEGGKQQTIWSFDPKRVVRGILAIRSGTEKFRLAVKLSPISDPGLLKEVLAAIVQARDYVQEVVCSNTFPNGYLYDGKNKRDAIDPNDGLGGVSGMYMLPIAAGQVRQARRQLPKSMDVIGVGGIRDAESLVTHLMAGADGTQVGTENYRTRNPRIFSDILQEFVSEYPKIAAKYA